MESKRMYGFWKTLELCDPTLQLKNAIKSIKECEKVLLEVNECVINEKYEDLLLKISKYKEKYMTKKEGKG